jgi:hypothetical protein
MAVTTEQWLKMVRRKVADVDRAAERRTDTQLLEAAGDAALELGVRQVAGFSTIAVGTNKAQPGTYGLQGATDDQAMILVYAVAADVLWATYRQRVDRGELGISWRSGLEEESSIQAEKAYRGMLEGLELKRDELLVTYQRQSANARIH